MKSPAEIQQNKWYTLNLLEKPALCGGPSEHNLARHHRARTQETWSAGRQAGPRQLQAASSHFSVLRKPCANTVTACPGPDHSRQIAHKKHMKQNQVQEY